jgi:hypothetical protein
MQSVGTGYLKLLEDGEFGSGFLHPHSVQTGSGTDHASYPICNECSIVEW